MRKLFNFSSLLSCSFWILSLFSQDSFSQVGPQVRSQVQTETNIKKQSDLASSGPNNKPASYNKYCIALRGNGELMPAHLGGLANAIETFGVPNGIAGGSSASISSFLLESIYLNPLLQKVSDPKIKALYMAFLLKVVEGIIINEASQPKWKALFEWIKLVQGETHISSKLDQLFKALVSLEEVNPIDGQNFSDLDDAFRSLKESGILYGPGVKSLRADYETWLKKKDALSFQVLMNTAKDLKRSYDLLGRFDAMSDHQLLLREGIVDFEALALLFGKIANFLSLREAPIELENKISKYLKVCAKVGINKTWSELASIEPNCKINLSSLFKDYNQIRVKKDRINDTFGVSDFHVIISTAIAVNQSADIIRNLKEEYLRLRGQQTNESYPDFAKTFGDSFQVNNEEILFGYWGSRQDLRKIEVQLKNPNNDYSRIDKAKRFYKLGSTTWKEALSLSPAEPGLSSYREFIGRDRLLTSQNNNNENSQDSQNNKNENNSSIKENIISLGGWSDLHPMISLKALSSDCEKVVYVTRKGGDSLFATGLAKRLFGFPKMSWDYLNPYDKDKANKVANNGSPYLKNLGVEIDPTWASMYDLANPWGNMAFSLRKAEAVVCTNWNAYDIKKDFTSMIKEAYRAPVYFSTSSGGLPGGLVVISGLKDLQSISLTDNLMDENLGYRPFAGCIPFD